MKKAIEILKKNIKKDGEYTPKLWEKYGKSRIYVSRNKYEQSGYITKDKDDTRSRDAGELNGWHYNPTRPGNISTLTEAIEIITTEEVKEKVEEVRSYSPYPATMNLVISSIGVLSFDRVWKFNRSLSYAKRSLSDSQILINHSLYMLSCQQGYDCIDRHEMKRKEKN